ncbi:amino acid permease [Helicobacter mustelae]|uniref:Probable S-methylmethionine permease n=1 Tax=Helicobacter mustelae (strain ATCC 43772 / CCUG 25715 / CIP 103759 / LMG 18044 / NCTC 12198 / R85-136P) TaxID=679897 RepID=D3UJE5_HELM1|nr:amino acid permease [Helicobacter mustelae]CBG40621.1 probable S-methylmethionine permease [Helicobacter mustelae 12198]SQH72119.1 S-methylmethionine permease [Helicobacter mustelae]
MKEDSQQDFHRIMKNRHLMMIAFGGVIGTGLFVATGENLHQAGALGTLLSYAIGALIVCTVMLSLGELSSMFPNTSSFGDYAHRFISPSTGYVVTWLYWLTWVAALGGEFTAVGLLMQKWFPDVPVWVWASIFGVVIFVLNIWTVRVFAEGEFIFSGIKVIAVILFLLLGFGVILYNVFHFGVRETFVYYYKDGWFPNGLSAILMTILAVNFAFSGTEVIGVAVGETKDPGKAMPKAINATLWRLVLFFIGTVFIIATLLPYDDARLSTSPFVAVLDKIGIPFAGDIMNFIIIIAIFSVSNSGLYASSRMLWSLGNTGKIPRFFGKVNHRGTPVNAVIFSMLGSLSALSSLVFAPEIVFSTLIGVSGFTSILTWMSVSLAQYNFRKSCSQEMLAKLPYKTPFMPYTPIIALFLCSASIIGCFFDTTQRISIFATLIFVLVCYGTYFLTEKKPSTINS